MENRTDVTVPMPGAWVDAIDEQLEYGDARAAWIRDAVKQRFEREGIDLEEWEQGNKQPMTTAPAD